MSGSQYWVDVLVDRDEFEQSQEMPIGPLTAAVKAQSESAIQQWNDEARKRASARDALLKRFLEPALACLMAMDMNLGDRTEVRIKLSVESGNA